MIDEQSPASGHDYASNRGAIGAGRYTSGDRAIGVGLHESQRDIVFHLNSKNNYIKKQHIKP